MRKLQLSILIVLGVLIFGITSCGNEIVQENPPKPDTPPDPTTPDKTDSDDRNLSLYEMILGTVKNIGDDIDDTNDPEEPVDPIDPNKEIETFTETVNGVSFDMVAVDGEQKFWIGRHEVTQKLWKAVMGTSPSRFHGDEMPVEKVSWNDAQTFVLKLTQLTGHSYRLPSLREWSYAAKGGSTPKGYKYSGSDNLNEVAWYYENSNSTTHEVGNKKCNELEIFDMSGNVSEWCAGGNDKERYAIGGSWYNFDNECDLNQVRTYDNSDTKGSNLGFRLALSSKDQKAAPKIMCRLSNPDEIYKDSPLSVEVRSDIACNISIKVDGKNIDSQDNISVLVTDVATNEVGRHIVTITATASGNIQAEEVMEYVVIEAPNIEKEKTIVVNGVSFDMILVEHGTFRMGEISGDVVHESHGPGHTVTLTNDYYIGKYEVTQQVWKAVMSNENPSYFLADNFPVEMVSWEMATDFISKLNKLTGLKFRLPTEAEWEFAAKGGTKSHDYKYSGSDLSGNVAWHHDNATSKTHSVGEKLPNELGIYDMTGNVFEWCQDIFSAYNSSDQTNPQGVGLGSKHVLRGGGYSTSPDICLVICRWGESPTTVSKTVGFRLALEP